MENQNSLTDMDWAILWFIYVVSELDDSMQEYRTIFWGLVFIESDLKNLDYALKVIAAQLRQETKVF